ncbi:TPA: hypothetical protein N0F65_002920 [Lagenidium giganteum]|uniref:Uncharacterized protein n=1 Tax=Lagenidium giganteum TaxID=4803 RepID=A0AAV2Z8G0_9STRA|nr:TPA: hypothetical protein N0F65_002920 [Lagenidium giganteum]
MPEHVADKAQRQFFKLFGCLRGRKHGSAHNALAEANGRARVADHVFVRHAGVLEERHVVGGLRERDQRVAEHRARPPLPRGHLFLLFATQPRLDIQH